MKNYKTIFHQIVAVVPLGMNELAMGFGYGWGPPTIKKLLDGTFSEISPTADECSWIASLSEFGRALGPLFSMSLLDTLGRKLMIQLGAAIFLAMWLSILLTRSVLTLCMARFAFGLSVGMCDTISSIYVGEICSPKIRGIFSSASVACFYLGLLVEIVLATYLSYKTNALISSILVCVCLLSTFLLVESPQFLLLRECHQKAEKKYMWLKGTTDATDISSEFEDIKLNIASEKIKKTSYKKLLQAPANYRSVIIMLILNISSAATGYYAIENYSPLIFSSTKFLTSYEFTIGFAFIQLISSVSSAFVIEKYNRRTLTLISFSFFTICHTMVAFLFYTDVSFLNLENTRWIIFFLICTFASFNAIMDSVMHAIRGEIFPQSIKPFGSGLCIMALSFMGFATIKTFLVIRDTYGIYLNFAIYAVVSLTAFWYSYFKLPETRGKTLINIQKSLEN